MIARLKLWLQKRRMDRAQAMIESYGLSVVRMKTVAGTTYIQHADGELLRLVKVPRGGQANNCKVPPFETAKAAR